MAVSNHQSSLDPIVQLRVLPVSLRVLAMRELFRIPLFGAALRAIGMIEVDRQSPDFRVTSSSLSTGVHQRPPKTGRVVTQLVTQPSPGVASSTPPACRRRPKAKYDSDPELTSTAAMIHIRFEPRIWLAGRRLMSTSTAVLRTASPIAAAMISFRLRSLRSLPVWP